MHIEPPDSKLDTFKDFAKHYLMIVLSILTALGLEAWIEHAHHRHAAEVSQGRMDRELAAVVEDIRGVEKLDQKSLSGLKAFDDMIVADFKSGLAPNDISKHILEHKEEYAINTNWPSLPTNAWDAAVADQSIGWIDPDVLQSYAAAYTAERTLSNWLLHDSTLFVDAPRLIDTYTDLNMDHTIAPYAFLQTLREIELMLSNSLGILKGADDTIQPAVSGKVGTESKQH
jgi:hypothetical protein